MERKIIVGLGEALWDCLPEGRKIGGAPANFAYHASQFGFDSYAVSAVGKDALGDETIEALKANGLKLEMPRVDFPTGQVQVTLDEDETAVALTLLRMGRETLRGGAPYPHLYRDAYLSCLLTGLAVCEGLAVAETMPWDETQK